MFYHSQKESMKCLRECGRSRNGPVVFNVDTRLLLTIAGRGVSSGRTGVQFCGGRSTLGKPRSIGTMQRLLEATTPRGILLPDLVIDVRRNADPRPVRGHHHATKGILTPECHLSWLRSLIRSCMVGWLYGWVGLSAIDCRSHCKFVVDSSQHINSIVNVTITISIIIRHQENRKIRLHIPHTTTTINRTPKAIQSRLVLTSEAPNCFNPKKSGHHV